MMAVRDFEEYVKDVREDFRATLDSSDLVSINMTDTIMIYFNKCTNQFEEDTLIENLKEEFENYLKEFKEENTCPDYTEEDRMDDLISV